MNGLLYKLNSGKPNKMLNFISGLAKCIVPKGWYRMRRQRIVQQAKLRLDFQEILRRRDYYIRLVNPFVVSAQDNMQRTKNWMRYTGVLSGISRSMFHTAYYLDQRDVMRYFPQHFRMNFCPGDVYFTPDVPTVVKSRLLAEDNQNSVILKLDKLRHFMFVCDSLTFSQKCDKVIFRGKIRQSRVRTTFLQKFFGSELCDCGIVGGEKNCPKEWQVPKKTIREHLKYKFIMALEGNDVASNLKWVMSSNSIAVMTRPTCETWFMEGTLRPDYHYIEVKEDFSDLEAKIQYYIQHPQEAEAIIQHAHEYVQQFRDEKREQIIQIMIMEKYFQLSGQLKED